MARLGEDERRPEPGLTGGQEAALEAIAIRHGGRTVAHELLPDGAMRAEVTVTQRYIYRVDADGLVLGADVRWPR